MSEEYIIVGREGTQPFPITDNTVSKQHIKVTKIGDSKVLVEDLGSKNGTYYNGELITKRELGINETIKLGNWNLVVAKIFVRNEEFEKLEKIWEDYNQKMISLQRENYMKNYLRSVPLFILAIVGFVINIIPGFNDYRIYIIVLGLILTCVTFAIGYKNVIDYPKKQNEQKQKFMINYVCPKCKRFLGATPFKGLRNQQKCSYCGTQWV